MTNHNNKYTLDYWKNFLKDVHDNGEHPISIVYGVSRDNELIYEDISKAENILVYGTTGSGKSIFLHSFIDSLISCNNKEEVKLILVDTKRTEMTRYHSIDLLLLPIAQTYVDFINALTKVLDELNYRKGLEHNKKLPHIILIIDDYLDVASSEVECCLDQILREGNKYGIHIILTTQLISDSQIKKETKDLFRTKVCQAYIGKQPVSECAELKGRGDSIVLQGNIKTRVQCLFSKRNH